MKCDRCQKEMDSFTMSWMNKDHICAECAEVEKTHPRFAEAKEIENREVLKGNYKYPGLFDGQKYPFK